ncbi:MAG: hypothetical protein H7X75_08680 [Burkholderiaceae bacterium]|nr:hypothetical protein [Burkholderiaceae bacterium]
MIDRLGRDVPRFPPACESLVAQELRKRLDALGAGPGDLAITQGACGADLLFAEAMLDRGAALHLHLPLEQETFITRSVSFKKPKSNGPDRWRQRFRAVTAHPATRSEVLPAGHGEEGSAGVFERCNEWMLARALAFGADKVRFICVWNGEGGDGPGGTAHMREVVKNHGGAECWIDTRKLCMQR